MKRLLQIKTNILHTTKTEELKKTKFKNDLILPHQPYHDEFLLTMTQVFKWSKWIGIVGLVEHSLWKLWGFIILALYLAIEGEAIWKVIKALAGWAIDTAGQRSVSVRLHGAMYYTASLLATVLCWRLSSSWKELRKYWASIEWVLSVKYVPPDATLRKRMYLIIGIVAVCTTIEHISNIISHLGFQCESQCLRKYILRSHGFLLLDFEYSVWFAVPILFMRILATIVRNLLDLIIILTSMGLTSRYKRLNECVAKVAARNNQGNEWREDTEFSKVYLWRKIREAYVKQSMLVRRVDKSLGSLILISAFFNFYFICMQLFLGVIQEKESAPRKKAYNAITMIWLSVRTAYTIVAAADVSKNSTLALPYLYDCNAQCYNVEIERLQKQLVNEYIALSGMGYFYLNRTAVLQMCGAVVTYVLVLVQYDNSEPSDI